MGTPKRLISRQPLRFPFLQLTEGLLVLGDLRSKPVAWSGDHATTGGQSIGHPWSETLRYHKKVAYLYEMNQVREAAECLLVSSNAL